MNDNIRLIENGDVALLYASTPLKARIYDLAPVLKALHKIKVQRKHRLYMKLYNFARRIEE